MDTPTPEEDFQKLGEAAPKGGTVSELFGFLKETKKWWLAPILIAILILGVFLIIGSTGAGAWVYTFF